MPVAMTNLASENVSRLKVAGSRSLRAVAITRRPCSPSRWFSAWYSSRNLPSAATGPASASNTVAARASSSAILG